MREHETTRRAGAASRGVLLLAVAVCAACTSTPKEYGRPPEGPVQRDETMEQRIARERRERAQGGGGTVVADPSSDPARIGVAATHRFHRRGCAELESVAPAAQTKFASCWDAINGDFVPCTRCDAGPRPDDGR